MNTTINENRPATKKQLWALYCITKKDYRNENLTINQASEIIAQYKNKGTNKTTKKNNSLEREFLDYMTSKMRYIINKAYEATNIKAIVSDDPLFTPENKRKSYAFFGFGCGFAYIKFDGRSKIGKQIEELDGKHRNTTLLNEFLKGFTKKELKYFENVGSPISALYAQDYAIKTLYKHYVADFMESKGVKNVRVISYYD